MTESVEEKRARWVRMLAECPKVGIELGPGPLRVDESADLSAEAFWAWMEQWFGDASDGADASADAAWNAELSMTCSDGGVEMQYGARRECVLLVQEPSVGLIRLGKVARRVDDLKWGYFNNISAEMRKTGEFAVAPCVVELMRAWGIELVAYWDHKTGSTFQTNIYTLCSEGRLVSYSYRPRYWHLPIGKWVEVRRRVGSIWASAELELEWTNQAEAQAIRPRGKAPGVQMAMF